MQNVIPPRSEAVLNRALWISLIAAVFANNLHAQTIFSENFDSVGALVEHGWTLKNCSQPGNPLFPSWFRADAQEWFTLPRDKTPILSRHKDWKYLAANYRICGGADNHAFGTISLWAVSPPITFPAGVSEVSFWSYSANFNPWHPVPDRLQVLFGSVNTQPPNDLSTGEFYPILDINEHYADDGYPNEWARYAAWVTTTQDVMVRLAFRYFVEESGGGGHYGTYIGIDDLAIEHAQVRPVLRRYGVNLGRD